MDQSPSPEPEEKAANADQTPDAQPVPDEVAALEQEEAEQSPSKSQGYGLPSSTGEPLQSNSAPQGSATTLFATPVMASSTAANMSNVGHAEPALAGDANLPLQNTAASALLGATGSEAAVAAQLALIMSMFQDMGEKIQTQGQQTQLLATQMAALSGTMTPQSAAGGLGASYGTPLPSESSPSPATGPMSSNPAIGFQDPPTDPSLATFSPPSAPAPVNTYLDAASAGAATQRRLATSIPHSKSKDAVQKLYEFRQAFIPAPEATTNLSLLESYESSGSNVCQIRL